MKTDDLIRVMANDTVGARTSLVGRMAALAIGIVAGAALLAATLGVRPDVGLAVQTWRFVFKVAVVATGAGGALWACARLVHPDARLRDAAAGFVLAPALLAVAVACELLAAPPAEWYARAIGTYARTCLVAVPLLSLLSLATVLAAMRTGAPRSPTAAGAVAGLLAGAIGATLYAAHCPDDSPLFLAIWYPLAVAVVVLLGAIVGNRLLRW